MRPAKVQTLQVTLLLEVTLSLEATLLEVTLLEVKTLQQGSPAPSEPSTLAME